MLSLQRASPESAAVAKRFWAASIVLEIAARLAACYRVNVGNSLTAGWLVSAKLLISYELLQVKLLPVKSALVTRNLCWRWVIP